MTRSHTIFCEIEALSITSTHFSIRWMNSVFQWASGHVTHIRWCTCFSGIHSADARCVRFCVCPAWIGQSGQQKSAQRQINCSLISFVCVRWVRANDAASSHGCITNTFADWLKIKTITFYELLLLLLSYEMQILFRHNFFFSIK